MEHFDPSRYSINVRRVSLPEGEFYEASVQELPDVIAYATCGGDAYEEAREALQGLYEDACEQEKPFPKPFARVEGSFSGRVTLRMGKSLHTRVNQLADRDDVSLNAWIVEAIAEKVGREIEMIPTTVQTPLWEIFSAAARSIYLPSASISLSIDKAFELESPRKQNDYQIAS